MSKISSPKISIVIPTFNSEKYIATCLDSILQQTFQDFEIIVIDDCSTDRSSEIVESYDDPRIKLYRQIKNSGESDSRNLGLKIAQGKYIYFMDHDDAILPQTLEIFYNAAEESQSEVVLMNSYFYSNDSEFTLTDEIDVYQRFFENPTPRFLSADLSERIQQEYIEWGTYVTPWIRIQRRDFLFENQIYFPKTTLNGDVLFHFAELCLARKIQVIDACGYIHRVHSARTMNSPFEKRLQKALTSMPIALKFIDSIFKNPRVNSVFDPQIKIQLESECISRFFNEYIIKSLDGEIDSEKINELINQIVHKSQMFSPELMRVLINTLSTAMIQLKFQGGAS